MVRKDFNSVFDTMCDYYGAKDIKLNEAVRELYFDQMKFYDPQEWLGIQKQITERIKYFPKITEIIEIAREYKNANKKTININEPVCECDLCSGTGYRFIHEVSPKGGIYTFAVACDCANGDNKLYDGRTIKDAKHRSNYICPRYSSIMPG